MQSFSHTLTNPYSSTSTRETAAWIETQPGSNRSKGQNKSQPLNNNNNICLLWGYDNIICWLRGGDDPSAVALGGFSLTSAELQLPLSNGYTRCCFSSQHNQSDPLGRCCVNTQPREVPTQHKSVLDKAIPAVQWHLTSWHPAVLPSVLLGEEPWAKPFLPCFGRGQSCTWEVKQRNSNSLFILPTPLAAKPFSQHNTGFISNESNELL